MVLDNGQMGIYVREMILGLNSGRDNFTFPHSNDQSCGSPATKCEAFFSALGPDTLSISLRRGT